MEVFIKENACENFICKMSAIFSRSQCIKCAQRGSFGIILNLITVVAYYGWFYVGYNVKSLPESMSTFGYQETKFNEMRKQIPFNEVDFKISSAK